MRNRMGSGLGRVGTLFRFVLDEIPGVLYDPRMEALKVQADITIAWHEDDQVWIEFRADCERGKIHGKCAVGTSGADSCGNNEFCCFHIKGV